MTGTDVTTGLPTASLKQYVAQECKGGVVDASRKETYMAVDITEAVSNVLHTRSMKTKGWKKGVSGLSVRKDDITWVVMPLCMTKVEEQFVKDITVAILLADGPAVVKPEPAKKQVAKKAPAAKKVAKKPAKKATKED